MSKDIAASNANVLNIPSDAAPIVVFLVDDQAIIGEAVRRALAGAIDIAFHYCDSATDAVAMAEQIGPTVILQDLVMPDIDGLTLVRRYRANPATRDIPIIVLSSKEDAVIKSEAFAADVNDYLVKLPDKVELIARIRHHSKSYLNRQQRDAAYRALSESQQKLLELNQELQRLSQVDGLTGISNRRYLDEFLANEWKRAVRDPDEFSVLMVDVDDFKKYNDTRGHLAGDEVLKQVVLAIKQSLRRPADLAARFGGEEFAVVLPGTDAPGALIVGNRIRSNLESLNVLHGAPGAGRLVTVSIGGACTIPPRGSTSIALLAAADEALYDAKRNGKNCVVMREMPPSASIPAA
jgi:two-component system chemotaxis family response regulator WspR